MLSHYIFNALNGGTQSVRTCTLTGARPMKNVPETLESPIVFADIRRRKSSSRTRHLSNKTYLLTETRCIKTTPEAVENHMTFRRQIWTCFRTYDRGFWVGALLPVPCAANKHREGNSEIPKASSQFIGET